MYKDPTKEEVAAELQKSLKQFIWVNTDEPNLQARIARVMLDQVDELRKRGKISIPMPKVEAQVNGSTVDVNFYDDNGKRIDLGKLGIPNYVLKSLPKQESHNFGKAMLRELREMNQYLRSSTIDKEDGEQILDLLKVIEQHVKIATKP